jgi:hypothetical protein
MLLASQNTDAMTSLLMEPTLSFLALNNWLLSTVLTAVWILVCNDESKSHPQ